MDPLLRCNIWHLRGRDRDLLVDGGLGISSLRRSFPELFGRQVIGVATHTHLDHVGGLLELGQRAVHRDEADGAMQRTIPSSLRGTDYPHALRTILARAGYPVPDWLVTAIPFAGFDPANFGQGAFQPTRLLDEGEVIDLGDLALEVLHLPGHSPGSIGLWDERSATLFSGDAVYDGPLIDTLPGACGADYRRTMERLLDLPVQVVHGGHDNSFARSRLQQIARAYIDS